MGDDKRSRLKGGSRKEKVEGTLFPSQIFGENLREYRKAHGIRQQDLAERMVAHGHQGWWRATVSEVERGRRPVDVDELFGLALILDTPINLLLNPEGPDPKGPRGPNETPVNVGGPGEPPHPVMAATLVHGTDNHPRHPGMAYLYDEENRPTKRSVGLTKELYERRRKVAAYFEEGEE